MRSIVSTLVALMLTVESAFALDKVTLGLNWLPDPEAGGYYQALVDGSYARYGLDVTIMPGGPQTNGGMYLLLGKIEFYIGGDMLGDMIGAEQNFPTIVVAADFQKDPQAFLSHPRAGLDEWSDLSKATAFVSQTGLNSFYAWMVRAWGFSYDRVKPYNFNSAPFIADKHSIQQAYATSEPYQIEKQGGFTPNVFLLADYGFSGYATTIITRRDIVDKNPDLVRRFVDASAIGWYHYLYGDNGKANERIKAENPDLSDGQIAYSIEKLKDYGIVDSGDALKLGIGALNDQRIERFFEEMAKVGLVKPDTDFRKAYTLQFVNRGVGLELRPR